MSIFTTKGTLKAVYRKAILDRKTREKYSTFKRYLTSIHKYENPKELKSLTHSIEKPIEEGSLFFAHLSYLMMEKTNDWSDSGEQQVKMSFCRNILKIPAHIQLNYSHVHEFEKKCKEEQKRFKIDKWSLEKIKTEFENFAFQFLGVSLTLHDISTIHEILRFLGSKFYLQGGFYGHQRELIYGKGPHQKRGNYDIVTLTEELCRTPNTVMSMVAVIGDNQIYIRREAIESIFYQKWIPHAQHPEPYHMASEYLCSSLIKNKALDHYESTTSRELLTKKEAFIHDVGANILHHELGHGIIQHHVLPISIGSVAEATKICGETISVALLEILAEMAPLKGDLWGPFVNMCKEAETDIHVGSRDFWVYFSDAWFFDTDDEHLYTYSELMSLIMVSVLTPKKEIDFKKLRHEITYRDNYCEIPNAEKTLLEWALSSVHRLVGQLREIAENAQYVIEDQRQSFKDASTFFKQKLQQECLEIDESSYSFETALWSEIFDALYQNEENKKGLDDCFEAFEREIKQELLAHVAPSLTKCSELTLRGYLYQRILE